MNNEKYELITTRKFNGDDITSHIWFTTINRVKEYIKSSKKREVTIVSLKKYILVEEIDFKDML